MIKCIFLGRMTNDPEITYTQGESAMAIARFDFAVDRRGSREGEPNADFFRCTAFDRKAELLERFGRKGLKLLLTGKMQNADDRLVFLPPVNQQRQPAQSTLPAPSNQPPSRQPARQPVRQAARATARSSQRNAPAANKDDFMNIDDGMDDGSLPFN